MKSGTEGDVAVNARLLVRSKPGSRERGSREDVPSRRFFYSARTTGDRRTLRGTPRKNSGQSKPEEATKPRHCPFTNICTSTGEKPKPTAACNCSKPHRNRENEFHCLDTKTRLTLRWALTRASPTRLGKSGKEGAPLLPLHAYELGLRPHSGYFCM